MAMEDSNIQNKMVVTEKQMNSCDFADFKFDHVVCKQRHLLKRVHICVVFS